MEKNSVYLKDPKTRLGYGKAPVVEFVGPPGGGKTTSCRHFTQQLQANGFKVCVLQDIKDYIRQLPLNKKINLYAATLFQSSFTLVNFSAILAKHTIFSPKAFYRYLRLSIFDKALSQILKTGKPDLVLLEQWVIQELWSATIFKRKTLQQITPKLKAFYFPTDYVFYFDLDVETAAERIANRQSNLSRFDRLAPPERLKALKLYNNYLYQLFTNSGCNQKHILSTKLSPQENSGTFFRHLEPVLQPQLKVTAS